MRSLLIVMAWVATCYPVSAQNIKFESAIRDQPNIQVNFMSVQEFERLQLIKSIAYKGPEDEHQIQTLLQAIQPKDQTGTPITKGTYQRDENLLVGTPDTEVTINSIYRDDLGRLNIVIGGRSPSGEAVTLDPESVWAGNADGSSRSYKVVPFDKAAPPTVLEVIVDVSGSMKRDMPAVRKAVESLLDAMPDFVRCGLISFGSSVRDYAHDGYKPCRIDSFNSNKLKASGGTPLFAAVETSYGKLNADAFVEAQKAVVIITDGRPDDAERNQSAALLKNGIHTLVFFLGSKGSDAETILQPIADQFVAGGDDAARRLVQYFTAYTKAIKSQSVVVFED